MRFMTVVLLFACIAAAQQSTLDQANEAYSKQDYTRAAILFQQAATADSKSGAAWEGFGLASLKGGHFEQAEQAFQHAVDLAWRPYQNRLNLARVAAKQGNGDKALQILNDLAAGGKASQLRPYLQVPEFDSLRASAEFQKVQEAFKPCRTAEYRQFDFWVGDWEVQSPQGQPLGTNHVTLEQDGCLLVEHWKSGRGFETGTSFNYYDIRDRKWHQLYIANNGNAGAFPAMAGELKDGRMVLLTDVADGKQSRWTWYELAPGKVRQMAEQSTDGGQTWQTTWDSMYVKKQ